MKIALLEPLGVSAQTIEELSSQFIEAGHSFVYYDTKTTDTNELIERSAGADIVMIANNPYPAEVIEAADSLKMIAVAFTGIDHVNKAAVEKHGITVCNCAGYSDTSVAELTLGLTIDVLRHVVAADSAVRSGATSAGLTGSEIAGKTVGIIGVGKIGLAAARLYKAFGARVLGCCNPAKDYTDFGQAAHPEAVSGGIELMSLDDLLAQSDIVSLHTPLNSETRKMMGAAQFAKMKQGSIFINCARGAIVDNDALSEALASGRLAGAGIDVFDMEPPIPSDYKLLSAPNCIVTPHVAFLTQEAMQRRAKIEFDNVAAYLAGTPKNVCIG